MIKKFKYIGLCLFAALVSIGIFYYIEQSTAVKVKEDILVQQNNLENSFLSDTNYSIDNPKVILNPYKISPLTALIVFQTNDLTTPTVTIEGKTQEATITHTFTPSKVHILPIYGLYPDYENTVILKVNGQKKEIKIKTDPLPSDFVTVSKTTNNLDLNSENNDLYFTTPASTGYADAYDINGDVRWYLTDTFVWDIQRLRNGHLLLSSNRLINPPYYMTGLSEMDLLGKIYYEYSLPGGYHHDVYELDNGNFLVCSNNFNSGTVEDNIVEVDRNNGNVIKKFDLSKILPTNEGKNEYWTEYDWFHNNSVWYDRNTNSITVSGRHMDIVVNIDYNSKEINWILGDSSGYSKKYQKYFLKNDDNNFEWQWAQHAAMILDNGDVFLFDNGNNRSKDKSNYVDANDNYSRAVIYHIDRDAKTVSQVWEYGKERGSAYYSPYISDVDYLNKNHYLITSGGHSENNDSVNNNAAGLEKTTSKTAYITELDNDNVSFELELPTNIYRAEKLSLYANDTYTSGAGTRLGSMGKTKVTNNSTVLFAKYDKKIIKKYNIKLLEEADRLSVSGSFKKSDKVKIILDNFMDTKSYNVKVSSKPYTALCVDLKNNNPISVTKYINKEGLSGKYYIYIKINNQVYKTHKFIIF